MWLTWAGVVVVGPDYCNQQERDRTNSIVKKAMSGTKIIIRPWSDFLSTSDVSVPKRADVLSERIRLNLNHWLGNYLCIVAAFVVMAGYLQAPFPSSFMFLPFDPRCL